MYKQYLGDSVYANFDGYHVVLTTEQGDGVASNRICLEDKVFNELRIYVEELHKHLKRQHKFRSKENA